MADMSTAMQLATQPRGGLQQVAPPQANPTQQANPMAMAQQTTGQAQGFDSFAETLGEKEQAAQLGDQAFMHLIKQRIAGGLASQQEMDRTRQQLFQRNLELMRPTEYSGMDMLAQGITGAGSIAGLGVGEALARMGAGTTAARQLYDKQEREKAKAAYDMADKRIESDDTQMINAMAKMQALGGAKPEFYLPDGTPIYKSGTRLVYVDKDGKAKEWLGAEKTVLGADTLYGKRVMLVDSLAKQWLERGVYKTLEEATTAAEAEADRLLGKAAAATGVGARPATPASETPAVGVPAETPTKPAAKQQVPTPPDFPKVTPEQQAKSDVEAYEILRAEIADASKRGDRAEVQDLQTEMTKRFPKGKPLAVAAPGATPKKDVPKEEMEKSTAGVTGENLGKDYKSLQDASAASAEMKMQLNTLRELYKTPNLPEGVLAEKLQGMRSSLKSLGVEVGPEVGAADMISAIGGKMALLTRTADGSNLMPGAMSDFEQKILRGLAPGLQQTAEGRAALVDFLGSMADIRIRLAKEANEMAKANRGILPSDWYSRRDRILKEEQARMALLARDMGTKFQGAK